MTQKMSNCINFKSILNNSTNSNCSGSFFENLSSEVFLEEKIISIANELEKRLQKSKIAGKTITLKLKYSDFTLQTRSKTLPYYISDKSLLIASSYFPLKSLKLMKTSEQKQLQYIRTSLKKNRSY